MTRAETESPVKRVVRAIGPWPLHPEVLGVGMGLVYLVAALGYAPDQSVVGNPGLMADRALAILAGVMIGLIAFAGRAWQRRHGVTWVSYMSFITMMVVVAPLLRTFTAVVPEVRGDVPSALMVIVRGFIAIMAINGVSGLVTRRLELQVEATQEALDASRDQQRRIIAADEDARRQASLLLHDHVQAKLITICLEMRGIAERVAPVERRALMPILARLEEVRSLDLRTAARALSPNLEDIDLQTALEDLAVQYEPVLAIEVHVDPQIDDARRDLGVQLMLACYRIVEQGLINVATHADASTVLIRVLRTATGLRLEVSDDGRGLPDVPERGLGSAIISAWTLATDGTWGWKGCPNGPGTVLFADLVVPPTTH